MNRRRFLESSTLAGVGMMAAQAGCARSTTDPAGTAGGGAVGASGATAGPGGSAGSRDRASGTEPFELHEATIDSLQ